MTAPAVNRPPFKSFFVVAVILVVTVAAIWLITPSEHDLYESEEVLTRAEHEYLQAKKGIVFVGQSQYPPFEFVNKNSDYDGMTVELIRWMATDLGFKAEFTHRSFAEAQAAVQSGEADVLTSFFYSVERDKTFDFTDILFKVPASIFVHGDRTDIKDIRDLNGKTIAMQQGDYALEFLKNQNLEFDVAPTQNFADATDMVIHNEADALIGDEQIVMYHIFSNDLTDKIKRVGEPIYVGRDCMATRESETVLINILNKGIQNAREKGALKKTYRKWLGTSYSLPYNVIDRIMPYILVGSTIFLLLLAGVWYWNFQLRREIMRRTEDLRRSNASLRESRQQIKEITDNVNAFLWSAVIEEGQIVSRVYTENIYKITGYRAAEFTSPEEDRWLALVHPEDQPIFEEGRRRIKSDETFAHEYRIIHKNGSVRWVFENASPQFDETNHLNRIIGITIDVTARKQTELALKESEDRLARAEALSMVMITHISLTGQWLKVPGTLPDLLGYSEEQLLQSNFRGICYPDDFDAYWQDCQRLIAGERQSFDSELRLVKGNGRSIWVDINTSIVTEASGKPVHFLAFIRDVTERKYDEDALKKYAAELERSNQELQNFASIASHDLREPLRKIMVFGNRLESKYADVLDESGRDYLQRMQRAADRMQQLIDGLLTLARVTTRGQPFVPIDLNQVAKEVISDLEIQAERTHARFEVGTMPTIEADKMQIYQLLQNLVNNSLKFKHPERDPVIQIEAKIITDEHGLTQSVDRVACRLTVRDNGLGFEEKHQERIFTIFQRLNPQSKFDGTGMGLAICRRICERHGGCITATGEPGLGATFIVYLPVKHVKEKGNNG